MRKQELTYLRASSEAECGWLSSQNVIPHRDSSWLAHEMSTPILRVPPALERRHASALSVLENLSVDAAASYKPRTSHERTSRRPESPEQRTAGGIPSPRFAQLAPLADAQEFQQLDDWFDRRELTTRQPFFDTHREFAREMEQGPLDRNSLPPVQGVISDSVEEDPSAWTRPRPLVNQSMGMALKRPSTSAAPLASASERPRAPSSIIRPRTASRPLTVESEHLASLGKHALPGDARSKFLYGCLRLDVRPRVSLLIRDARTSELCLAHQGIGDELGRVFAECLASMPMLRHLDLEDNRLTDSSLVDIINGIAEHGALQSLNLSRNDFDEHASTTLGNFMGNEHCALQKLELRHADVSDAECAEFVRKIRANPDTKISYIDMSHNLIGLSENLNVLQPDFQTGSEALADWLDEAECNLKFLDLSWNMIRGESAIALGMALADNRSLQVLNLAFNCFGVLGGEAVGHGLLYNSHLRKLNLANNDITPRAAFVIAVFLMMNEHMTEITLDGNPVGEVGGGALVRLPIVLGYRLNVSMRDTDLKCRDPNGEWEFKPDLLLNYTEYKLDMSVTYEHAAAYELLRQAAMTEGCSIPVCEHTNSGTSKEYKLTMKEEVKFGSYTSSRHKNVNLDKLADCDVREVFLKFDVDRSNAIDRAEMTRVLGELELPHEQDDVDKIFRKYDLDNSGIFELSEFLDLIGTLKQEMKQVQQRRRFMSFDDTGGEFIPPKTGTLKIGFRNDKRMPDFEWQRCTTTSDAETRRLVEMIRSATDKDAMLELSLVHLNLHFEQAQLLYREILREEPDSSVILSKLLPCLCSAQEAHALCDKYMVRASQRRRLMLLLGPAYQVVLGFPTGHYRLSLAKPEHRLCAGLLIKLNNTECFSRRSRNDVGDTSQHSNWQNFRNEIWNDGKKKETKPIVLSPSFWNKQRTSGVLEFDYVSTTRPVPGTQPLSSKRFGQLLTSTGLYVSTRELDERIKQRLDTERSVRQVVHRGLNRTCTAGDLKPGERELKPGESGYPLQEEKRAHRCGAFMEALRTGDASLSSDSEFNSFFDLVGSRNQNKRVVATKESNEQALRADAEVLDGDAGTSSFSRGTFFGAKSSEHEKEQEPAGAKGPVGAVLLQKLTAQSKDPGPPKDSPDASSAKLLSRPSVFTSREEVEADIKRWNMESMRANELAQPGNKKAQLNQNSELAQQRMRARRRMNAPKGLSSAVSVHAKSSKFELTTLTQRLQDPIVMAKMKKIETTVVRGAKAVKRVKDRNQALARLCKLQDTCSSRWFSSEQVQVIASVFLPHWPRNQKEQEQEPLFEMNMNLRVEIIVTLHARTVDLHNFDNVLRMLPNSERAQVIHRLGRLNTWTPLKPEGPIMLDLDQAEERTVAKMLVHLKAARGGDAGSEANRSWFDETFQWTRHTHPIPGWEPGTTWYSESGVPTRGVLALTCVVLSVIRHRRARFLTRVVCDQVLHGRRTQHGRRRMGASIQSELSHACRIP